MVRKKVKDQLNLDSQSQLRAFLEGNTGRLVANLMNDYEKQIRDRIMDEDMSPEEVLRLRERAKGVKNVFRDILDGSNMSDDKAQKMFEDTFA